MSRLAALTVAAALTAVSVAPQPAVKQVRRPIQAHVSDVRLLLAAYHAVTLAAMPEPTPSLPDHWLFIAACESGDRINGVPRLGTHRWDYGVSFSHGDIYEGAFNFHPGTWDAYRDADMPEHAGLASPAEQLEVAERVLAAQGWQAWPTCSRMAGLR